MSLPHRSLDRDPKAAGNRSRPRRRKLGAVVATLLISTCVTVIVALPSSAGPSTLTAPAVAYTDVDQVIAFTGTDPITNATRDIQMDAVVSGSCNPTSGNGWSISLCGRVQIGLTDMYGGTLFLPGTTQVQTSPDVYQTASGAIVENPTENVFTVYMNGTLDQLNDAIDDLEYHPAAGYEDTGTNVPNIDILVNDGSASSTNALAEIVLRVEGTNDEPTMSAPAGSLDASAGADNLYPPDTLDPAVFSVVDPELCLPDPNNKCDGAYATTAPFGESDDLMLMVAWLAETDCGTFNFRGATGWANLGGPSSPLLNGILTSPTGLDLQQPQADAILATLPAFAAGLDLSTQSSSPINPTTVFAGTAALEDVRYALSQLTFSAPPDDATCNLNLAVSDLGNNGMPLEWIAADDGPPVVPAYEIPNALGSVTSATFNVSDTAPDASITALPPDPAGALPAQFAVSFSEDVTGFDASSDLTVSGSATGVSTAIIPTPGDASTYLVEAVATGDGDITLAVPAGAAQAVASPNGDNEASSGDATVTWDGTDPTVTIEQGAGQADPTTGSSIVFDVVFSEPVSGFATGDVTLGGSALATSAEVTGGPSAYTVTVTGMSVDGDVTASIGAGVAADDAGNGNSASTSADNTVTWSTGTDVTEPTVTIDQGAGQADPATGSSIVFDVVFSEPVSGFVTGDVTLGGSALATSAEVTGGPSAYTVTVTGMSVDGDVTASIGAGVAEDAATNLNEASTSSDNTVTWSTGADVTPPTVTINQGAGQADPTTGSSIVFDVVFSEPVSGFATGDVTLGGSALATSAEVTGGPSAYTVTVTGMSVDGDVTATVGAGVAEDAATNPNDASTSSDNSVTWSTGDVVAPTVTIDQGAGQADPTTGSSIVFDVVFSEPVSGFATGDVTLSGSALATSAEVTGGPSTYTVTVTGMAVDGDVTASIGAGVAEDAATNPNEASTSGDDTVTWDSGIDVTEPTVTIDQGAGQADPTTGSSIVFDVVFSEPVSGFATGDVTLGGSALATSAEVTGGPSAYTVTVTGMSADGDVTASVGAGVAQDAATNLNEASTSSDNTVTWNEPVPPGGSETITTPGGDVVLDYPTGCALDTFTTGTPVPPPPSGVDFPYGQLDFTATCAPGSLVTFTLTLPGAADAYYKLVAGAWAEFTFDGETGAEISGDTITITIRDNGRGDDDPALGTVTDPGAPGVGEQTGPTTTTSTTSTTTPDDGGSTTTTTAAGGGTTSTTSAVGAGGLTPTTTAPSSLPVTGAAGLWPLTLGLVLVVAGMVILEVRRRRLGYR